MRILIALLTFTLISGSAVAGTVTTTDTGIDWQSTECKEPPKPASIFGADRETRASAMNSLSAQYNAYTAELSTYLSCLGDEGTKDAAKYNQAIIEAVEKKIGTLKHEADLAGQRLEK